DLDPPGSPDLYTLCLDLPRLRIYPDPNTVAAMYQVLALCFLVGVAMAVPVEDRAQKTALEKTARTTGLPSVSGTEISVLTTQLMAAGMIAWNALLYLNDFQWISFNDDPPPGAADKESSWSSYSSYAYRRLIEAAADDEGMFKSILESIDPVDMSFRFMEIENSACRKRALCELSATPLIGQAFRYISQNISYLNVYQDAISAGEAIQDCALLFSECPENQNFANNKQQF
ncbi:unnamed protein product, partial [Meganyctiphanes norvegica]